jgi:hypothetical protein
MASQNQQRALMQLHDIQQVLGRVADADHRFHAIRGQLPAGSHALKLGLDCLHRALEDRVERSPHFVPSIDTSIGVRQDLGRVGRSSVPIT